MSGQRSDWRERLHADSSRMEQESAFKLQADRIFYQTQVEIHVTTADFYFPTHPRPLIVVVDGRVHLGQAPDVQTRRTTNPTKKERIPSPGTILPQLLRQEKRRTLPQYSGLSRQLGSIRDSTTLRNGHAKNEILRARMNPLTWRGQ
jgi:hypothetical protein